MSLEFIISSVSTALFVDDGLCSDQTRVAQMTKTYVTQINVVCVFA